MTVMGQAKTVFGSSTIKRTGKAAKGVKTKGIARLGSVSTNVKLENTHKQSRLSGTK